MKAKKSNNPAGKKKGKTMKSFITALILFMGITVTYAGISKDEEDARIKELDEICIQTRAELLKPVITAKVEDCVNNKNKERAYCERFFKDYGWGGMTGNGTSRNTRFFDQIPECIEAFEARKNRKHL